MKIEDSKQDKPIYVEENIKRPTSRELDKSPIKQAISRQANASTV